MSGIEQVPVTIAAASPTVSSQLFGSGLIGLREGLEAGIVVMILVAFLVKAQRRDALKWVWFGAAGAIAMTVAVFLTIQLSAYTVSGLGAEAIAGVASLVAVTIVTTTVLWMKTAAAGLSGELRSEMARALETGSLAVLALAFLAVGREGVETALFMVGYAEAETAWPLVGLVVGVLVAAAIAYGMYAGAIRINLSRFFKYTGVFLIVVAAGILAYGIGALQTVGWLPGLSSRALDISSWFTWSAWYGEIIQGVFNVTPTPTVLQFVAWLSYLVIVLALFLRPVCASKPAVVAAAMLAGISMTSCTAKQPGSTGSTADGSKEIAVSASDTVCELSDTQATTGTSTFVVTNNGSKVTEFYVYGEGERVLGEVENISPGVSRRLMVQLGDPGTYQLACKPGMVGDGIRSDFTVSGAAIEVDTEGKFTEAADSYRRYVSSQSDALLGATEAFVAAIKAKDIVSAKAQFPTSRVYWERIEPVAESFPDNLDPRVDLREANLEPGQRWTGFHRLEKDLWVTGLQPDTNAIADQLVADVQERNDKIKAPQFGVDSTQIAGGAQRLLDEISISKISGEEDIFSHTDLWDFQANVEGSQTAVASVRPILDERNPDLGKRVDQRFASVQALLQNYRNGDGFVSYDAVTEPQRHALSRAIDALSKEVSQVQGAIAPQ